MSCFGGILNEYKYLSIDRFDGANLSSWCYLLSHCHSDHMVGLDAEEFAHRLDKNIHIRLYCSEVTGSLLLADNKYTHLSKHVCTLPIEHPQILEITDNNGEVFMVSVTLLPAAHCPGSVMFLLEGSEGNVLYTGDFRLPKGSGGRMRCLHMADGSVKKITSMYVDTTFCRPDAIYIPSREDCLKKLHSIASDWFAKGKSNAIRLNLSAKYGYEYLFRALHQGFGTKIYCQRKKFYRCIPDVYNIMTTDVRNAKVFACFKTEKISDLQNRNGTDIPAQRNILRLTLSTMYFTYTAQPHEICRRIGENHYRLCFSFHSSHSEVCDFVKYFQPDRIYANVRPGNRETLEEVEKRLVKDCLIPSVEKEPQKCNPPSKSASVAVDAPVTGKICLDNSLKAKQMKRMSPFRDTDEDSEGLFQKLTEKYLKKRDRLNPERDGTETVNSDSGPGSNDAVTDDYNLSSSPDCTVPTQHELDELYIKIAPNNGKLPQE